jgi:predicted homoserine dehydrogenase-like protein
VAQAVLFKTGTGTPLPAPAVEVIAIAKRDLAAGETLDGMGSHRFRGEAELASVVNAQRLLPYGLAERVTLRRPVRADQPITHDDLEAPGDTHVWRLRAEHGLLPA